MKGIWVLYEIYQGPEDAYYFLNYDAAFNKLRKLLADEPDAQEEINRLENSGGSYIEFYPYIIYYQPVDEG